MSTTTDNPKTPGNETLPLKDRILETGAGLTQSLKPISSICAHLNAFHVYADDPSRCVEANHYCSHISEDLRQCLIYDTDAPNARLIGIEYMITPRVFATLPAEERKLWHTHVYEVKSGMLIMPYPAVVPRDVWEIAETKEMEQAIGLYGKTYHLWQVDRGDQVPMGEPKLMMSITDEQGAGACREMWRDRDGRYGVDCDAKAEKRKHIERPEVHLDADGGSNPA